ncbi:MAG: NUDIX hydrolase N-terminal domain-containing protein [Bacilli bacterium]|jgi:8-oxo-dGTP diphosphatase
MDKKQFYDFIIKMQAISKIGLLYSKDPYALDNYRQINDLSAEMLSTFMDTKFDRPNYFKRDVYPTPNVSVRTVVLNENGHLLLVKEAKTGNYSLPGGWCDMYDSPSEAALAEVSQEAGLDIEIVRLVGVINRTPHTAVPEYVICFEGRATSPFHAHCHETTEVNYFPLDALPELSPKLQRDEFMRIVEACRDGKIIYD